MILSNIEIKKAIDECRLVIDPLEEENFDTSSLDLRLGNEILVPKKNLSIVFNPEEGSIPHTLKETFELKSITSEGHSLKPNEFIISNTLERIKIPIINDGEGRCLAARVEGKSSRARIGMLVHFTAPTVHAGFEGTITLEMINLGPYPIRLTPSMKICQLIFEKVQGIPNDKPSQFQGQTTPAGVI